MIRISQFYFFSKQIANTITICILVKLSIDTTFAWCYNSNMKEIKVSRKLDRYLADDYFLLDFVNYCENFYNDLVCIKKYYQKEFDSKSENLISIDAHIEMFLRTFKQMVKIANTPERYESLYGKNNGMQYVFKKLTNKFSNLKDFYVDANDGTALSENYYTQQTQSDVTKLYEGTIINEKYYKKLEKLSNYIFTQEEIIAITTQKIWQKYIAKSVDDIKPNKYCCLVKVLGDWRAEARSNALDKYMESRYAMSVSLITDFKSRFFLSDVSYQTVGIIYSTKKIIGGKYKDAFLEEFIDGKCPLGHQEYNSIRQMSIDKNHTICSYASKIATPHSVLLTHSKELDTYNEVIIDRRKSTPIAVFYAKREDRNERYNEKAKNMAMQMAEKFNLPLVELEDKNMLVYNENGENEIEFN